MDESKDENASELFILRVMTRKHYVIQTQKFLPCAKSPIESWLKIALYVLSRSYPFSLDFRIIFFFNKSI